LVHHPIDPLHRLEYSIGLANFQHFGDGDHPATLALLVKLRPGLLQTLEPLRTAQELERAVDYLGQLFLVAFGLGCQQSLVELVELIRLALGDGKTVGQFEGLEQIAGGFPDVVLVLGQPS